MAKIKEGFKGERSIVLPPFVIQELQKETLSKELYITDIGYYPVAKYHFRERKQDEARQYVLIYCVEGQGWFKIYNQKFHVKHSQFFILPKGKAHSYGSNSVNPWTIYWLHFDGEHARFFAQGFDKPTDIVTSFNSRIEERLDLFDEIYITLSKGYSKNNLGYATTSLFHFLGSMKFLGEYRENSFGKNNPESLVEVVVHFMKENLGQKLSLNQIAQHAGISASHLSLVFQKETNYSPLRYFNHLKIQKACHYLDYTDMKVNQISINLGIEDAFYFSRMFTKVMGISPTEYRIKKKG